MRRPSTKTSIFLYFDPPYQGPAVNQNVNIELVNSSDYQLYHLTEDIGQHNNLAQTQPEKLDEMIKVFEAIRGRGEKVGD